MSPVSISCFQFFGELLVTLVELTCPVFVGSLIFVKMTKV